MEKEEGHLPFLDIDVYRKTDGSLGHTPISNCTGTHITILLTNNQDSFP
jgi:hypothetical protein